jgi:TP53 regulating kinase-like protein
VDLYVLERAFASTHPASEPLFAAVVEAYGRELGAKAWESVWQRLEEGSVVQFVRKNVRLT